MEKIIERNLLFDYYGELLTQRQKDIFEDAVYGDMSLSELADNYGISRQGAHDFLKRCDKILLGYESKLRLIEKAGKIKKSADEIRELADGIPGTDEAAGGIKDQIYKCLDEIRDNL